jgi:predicted RNA-binding protein
LFTASRDNSYDEVATLFLPMTKTLTADVQRNNAERQLFGARRALGHLLELYESGQWKSFYKEAAFAEAVRQARQAVDHWTGIVSRAPED